MVQPPDDDTQRLLRLLALKRHEVPPPGFFDRLPNRVILSLRAGAEVPERSAWQALLSMIRGQPMIAGSYAALGVGALLFGVSVFQMAVDTDAPALAESGLASPGAAALPGMFLAGSAADPASPVPPMPAGVVFRISPTPASPFSHRAGDASHATYLPTAYDPNASMPQVSTVYGLPLEWRGDQSGRLVPGYHVTPAGYR